MIDATFEDIPHAFLRAYSREVMGWAGRLGRSRPGSEPLLKICLATMPEVTALGEAFVEYVTLACEVWTHPVSGDVKFLIKPASEAEIVAIRKHLERLPAIETAWRLAAARAKRARKRVDATFEDVPECFVRAYEADLKAWGSSFRDRGGKAGLVLRRIPGEPVALDQWGQEPMIGVELIAAVDKVLTDGVVLVIRPVDEKSRELIAKHAEAIERYGEPVARPVAN